VSRLIWTAGVTTTPTRRATLLPRTLASLRAGGFDRPRLFVDGDGDLASWEQEFGLEVTVHKPRIHAAAAWHLALWELYHRTPNAERFALFQDDMVCSRNLLEYLERTPYPPRGYCNLFAFPVNEALAPGHVGWLPTKQDGRGALALVFSREAVFTLLSSAHMAARVQDPHRGWKFIDGGVVEAMKLAGWREFVHLPSLTQHTGIESTMSKRPHLVAGQSGPLYRWHPQTLSQTFPGENFDLLTLLEKR
jgi:hypothetical protein